MKTTTMLLLAGAGVGAYFYYKKSQTVSVPLTNAFIDCIPSTTGAPGTADGCGGIIPTPATQASGATAPTATPTPVPIMALMSVPFPTPSATPTTVSMSGYYGGSYSRSR